MVGVGLGAVGPLLTRVVVDDAVAGSTAALVPVVTALVVLALVRYGASFVRRYSPGGCRWTSSTTCAGDVFAPSRGSTATGRTRCAPGRWSSRAITDLQLVQGLLSMVPCRAGTVSAVRARRWRSMLWLSPLLTLVALVVARRSR